jgi:membrane-bound metal-dependent hydrolase YbcI (DUF457 family)
VLGAVAAGWLAGRPADGRRARWRQVAILAAIGIAPDLDLLVGRHSMETHSIGAAVLVGVLAAWRRWPVASTRSRIFAAVLLAWLSHPLFDILALDTSTPLGVMLFWPFSREHLQTGWSVFAAISRRYWLDGFVSYTLLAIAREVIILLPPLLLILIGWRRRRVSSGRPDAAR